MKRIVERGTEEGAAIEVFVIKPANIEKHVYYTIQNIIQPAGWTAVDWQFIAISQAGMAGVPAGFSTHIISQINMVRRHSTLKGIQNLLSNVGQYVSNSADIRTDNPPHKLNRNGTITAKKGRVSWLPELCFYATYQS